MAKVKDYKQTIIIVVIMLFISIIAFTIWVKSRNKHEKMTLLAQDDTYFKDVSGQTEFRDKEYQNNNLHNKIYDTTPYTGVPLENDNAYITGINPYLWDKSKKK